MALPLFQAGQTVFQATNPVLEGPFFNSEYPVLKTATQKAGVVTGTGGTETIPHKLGYTPQYLLMIERIPGGRMNLVNNDYDPGGTWVSKDTGDSLDATTYADTTNIYLQWSATSGTYHYYIYIYYDPVSLI